MNSFFFGLLIGLIGYLPVMFYFYYRVKKSLRELDSIALQAFDEGKNHLHTLKTVLEVR